MGEPDGATVRFSLPDPNRDGAATQRRARDLKEESSTKQPRSSRRRTGSVRGGPFICGRRCGAPERSRRAPSSGVNHSLPFSPRESSKSVSSGAPQDTPQCPSVPPVRVRTGRESGLSARKRRKHAEFREETPRRRTWRAARTVLSASGRCSTQPEEWLPLDTDLERISLAGPRIKDLGAVVRDPEWCPVAITNSLCVKRVRVSRLVNTGENPRTSRERHHVHRVSAGTRCYNAPWRSASASRAIEVIVEQQQQATELGRSRWKCQFFAPLIRRTQQ